MTDHVDSSRAPEPVGAYPYAKRVGDLLFLSGIGPRRRGNMDIPGVRLENGAMVDYDMAEQCRSCFDNVRYVLEEAGGHWNDIVDVLVFLTDMSRDFQTYNAVYAEYFAGEGRPNPARTTVEVSSLPRGGTAPIAIEVKVIAHLSVKSKPPMP